MKIVLDTNRYSDFWRGDSDVVRKIEESEQVYFPFIALGELRSGFLKGTRRAENERTLEQFLAKPRVEVLLPDERTAGFYGALYHQLRVQGTPIPTNDVWIAALAVQHDLALYARDKHFDHLPQLMRI